MPAEPTVMAPQWRARMAALRGEPDKAISLLRAAFAGGLWYDLWVHTDQDLDSLRRLPEFRELTRPKG